MDDEAILMLSAPRLCYHPRHSSLDQGTLTPILFDLVFFPLLVGEGQACPEQSEGVRSFFHLL
jgi:hypothetical protein